ncbi:unnamed protein product [Sphagnum jensenii]|uniref:Uncharacterized protein n=1 Tax=Sphagnum jensenii TaxID=128206 RepID=A0ABP1ALC0_9BRYO
MDWWRSFTKVWTSTRGRLHRGMDRWRSFTKVWTGGGAHHRAPDLVVETREPLGVEEVMDRPQQVSSQDSTVVRIFIS